MYIYLDISKVQYTSFQCYNTIECFNLNQYMYPRALITDFSFKNRNLVGVVSLHTIALKSRDI